jgi:hypothetical protein
MRKPTQLQTSTGKNTHMHDTKKEITKQSFSSTDRALAIPLKFSKTFSKSKSPQRIEENFLIN